MSLPNGFPKGCGTHETPAQENTMKQQGALAADVDRTVPLEIVCKKKKKSVSENQNRVLVAVSSCCYTEGVGWAEEDVEFNRFFGFGWQKQETCVTP